MADVVSTVVLARRGASECSTDCIIFASHQGWYAAVEQVGAVSLLSLRQYAQDRICPFPLPPQAQQISPLDRSRDYDDDGVTLERSNSFKGYTANPALLVS